MKSIILASGFGARTYPVTTDIPKSLLPIRGKPAIVHIVNKVQVAQGIDEIFIISNQRFFAEFNEWSDNFMAMVPIKIISDGSVNGKDRLGALKSLSFVIDSCGIDDDLLVVGGDNLFSFDLDEFIDSSLKISPNPTIGVYNLNGKAKPNKFGAVILNKEGRVIDFYEKPPQLNGSRLISLCLYYFPKETLHLIKEYLNIYESNGSIGNYIKWLIKKCQIQSFTFEGDWFDIGDVDSYAEAVCLL